MNFLEILYWVLLRKSVEKLQIYKIWAKIWDTLREDQSTFYRLRRHYVAIKAPSSSQML